MLLTIECANVRQHPRGAGGGAGQAGEAMQQSPKPYSCLRGPGEVHVARFDEVGWSRGASPYSIFKEKEEVPEDEKDESPPKASSSSGKPEPGRRVRRFRPVTKLVIEDGKRNRGGGLRFEGTTAPQGGSAFVVVEYSKTKQAFVMTPVGEWLQFQRKTLTTSLESLKEVEQQLSQRKSKRKPLMPDDDHPRASELTAKERIEHMLRASLQDDGDAKAKTKSKAKKVRGPASNSNGGDMMERLRTDMYEGLEQEGETRELFGLGEDDVDDYEFQDDEEDLADENNVAVGEEEDVNEDEEEEEEDEEEEEEGNTAAGGELAGAAKGAGPSELPYGQPGPDAMSGRGSSNNPIAGGSGLKRPSEGYAAELPSKRAKHESRFQVRIKEVFQGVGVGFIHGKQLRSLLKGSMEDPERDKVLIRQLLERMTTWEEDPVQQDRKYFIRPEYR
jgi:hypothetical protein